MHLALCCALCSLSFILMHANIKQPYIGEVCTSLWYMLFIVKRALYRGSYGGKLSQNHSDACMAFTKCTRMSKALLTNLTIYLQHCSYDLFYFDYYKVSRTSLKLIKMQIEYFPTLAGTRTHVHFIIIIVSTFLKGQIMLNKKKQSTIWYYLSITQFHEQ